MRPGAPYRFDFLPVARLMISRIVVSGTPDCFASSPMMVFFGVPHSIRMRYDSDIRCASSDPTVRLPRRRCLSSNFQYVKPLGSSISATVSYPRPAPRRRLRSSRCASDADIVSVSPSKSHRKGNKPKVTSPHKRLPTPPSAPAAAPACRPSHKPVQRHLQ